MRRITYPQNPLAAPSAHDLSLHPSVEGDLRSSAFNDVRDVPCLEYPPSLAHSFRRVSADSADQASLINTMRKLTLLRAELGRFAIISLIRRASPPKVHPWVFQVAAQGRSARD